MTPAAPPAAAVPPAATGPPPHFLIIGAQKAGTTSLHGHLARHPGLFLSDPKEPWFFSKENRWGRGWDWYRGLFAGGAGKVCGEASANYAIDVDAPHAPERIARHLPGVKLIYLVRDPVERVRSAWLWHRRVVPGYEPDFAVAVRTQPFLIAASLYRRQLARFRAVVPDDRIKVLFLEEFAADPLAGLRDVATFLGVDPDAFPRDLDLAGRGKDHRAGRIVSGPVDLLRRGRWFQPVKNALIPAALRPWVKRLVSRPAVKPDWPPDLLAEVTAAVRDDARGFLADHGKPADFWPSVADAPVADAPVADAPVARVRARA